MCVSQRNSGFPTMIALFVSLLALVSVPCGAQIFGGLKAKIQKELDGNPFLGKEEIALRVVEEENGYVTIEMYEGNRKIREAIDKGHDILTTQFEQQWAWDGASESQRRTLKVLRRAIGYIHEMEGVKQVLLTAAVNTPWDRGYDCYHQNKYAEAAEWYRKAAEQGDADAQLMLGVMYELGQGVPQDYAQAAEWYRRAAEQGSATAQIPLGHMYRHGRGVPQDYAKAVEWYRKAAEQGNAIAQAILARMYEHGQGVPLDYAEAFEWWRKAAQDGGVWAQSNLGRMYEHGQGVPQDYAKALEWYHKAAEQGSPDAQSNLGWVYATCKDSRFRDAKKAVKYAQEATSQSEAKPEVSCLRFRSLAAAYARAGQFDKAVEAQEKSLALLKAAKRQSDKKRREALAEYEAGCEERLNLYKNRTPYVDNQTDPIFVD